MKKLKSVMTFLEQKIEELKLQYNVLDLDVSFDTSMRVGYGNAPYSIDYGKYEPYLGDIQLGQKNLSFAGFVTDLHFTMVLVALHHEFHHVKQFQNMRHNCNPYYGLMLNSIMATKLCVNNNRNDYYYENYRNNISEIDAIYGSLQDSAACYCDSMGDKGFMSPTNGHQSIFFNIHDMNFDSQICGRAWQQARNYERHPLDMDLVWDHRFEDMDEERYEQIFGHPPNMVPKSRPVPEIRGMEDMPSHDFSLGS